MYDSRLAQQIHFLREVEKLKTILRGNRTLDGRQENSAEHSWHVSLMAVLLQEHSNAALDMLNVIKMLLIHDLVEIDAGDTWLFDPNRGAETEAEEAAAKRLFALLPEDQAASYLALWYEFEARTTPEAQFAAAIDGLQPLLNHLITGRIEDGTIPVAMVREKKGYIKAYAPKLWDLVEQLIDESVANGLYIRPE